MDNQRVLVLLGPTAVGKSSFLYDDAPSRSWFVISADSMQIYRGADVVTATPSTNELERHPHACVNERDPSDEYNVSQFLTRANEALEEASSCDRFPVVVGGTGLYLKTFLYGMNEMPPQNPDFRQRLRSEAEETSRRAIHDRLREVDPTAADNIHPNDLKRTIRALEIYHETGRTKSELIEATDDSETIRDRIDPVVIGLKRPMDELRERIQLRTEAMVAEGLVEEIRRLRSEWELSETLNQAIGVSETIRHIEGNINRDELIVEISSNTYQFARKQMTWFRQLPVETWYHPDDDKEELIDHFGSVTRRTHSAKR